MKLEKPICTCGNEMRLVGIGTLFRTFYCDTCKVTKIVKKEKK